MLTRQVLKNCPVFSKLTHAELDKIAAFAIEKEYDAGATIYQEHDRAEELLVLEEGKIALQMEHPVAQAHLGRKVTVDVATSGEVVGWSAIIEPYIHELTSVCLQQAKVLAINSTGLRALFRENYHIGYEVLYGLVRALSSRLNDNRHLLVSERMLTPKLE